MKNYVIKVGTIMYDKKITIINDLNISKKTSIRYLDKILKTIKEINPSHIIIPGNLYSNEIDVDKINYFLTSLSKISHVFYVRGLEEKCDNLIKSDNITYLGEEDHCKNFYSDSINIFGMRLTKSYYNQPIEVKRKILLEYKKVLDEIKENYQKDYINVLVCYDSMLHELYKELDLSIYDIVITSNNYHTKEQTIQHEETLFFLSDSINPTSFDITNLFKSDINIDNLLITYDKKIKMLKKKLGEQS